MRLSLPFILLSFASVSVLADELTIHTIALDGSHRPAGFPEALPLLTVLGGKPVRVIWKDKAANDITPLTVDRITDTRRVPLTVGTAAASDGEWSWEWTPPVTRGVVTYEIASKNEGISVIRIEVRNPDEFRVLTKTMQTMEWEASGMDRKETDALTALGFRIRTTNAASNQALPVLRMTSSDPAQSRRTVTWDQAKPDLVVWRAASAAGDIDIRAPRWWISAEALATDEGRIRFLDLFSSSPASH